MYQADELELFDEYFHDPMLVVLYGSFGSTFVKKLTGFITEFLMKRLAEEDKDEDRESMSPFLSSCFDLFWKVCMQHD
jgi:hypothetical protein